jgi:Spy/CpxP family protein refolding chaperone
MKTKWFILTLAAILVAGGLITVKSHASEESPSPAFQRGAMLKRLADKLDLSADQRQAVRQILVSDKDTLKSLLERVHTARVDLRTAIRADQPSETAVRAASAKVADAEADMAVERMKLYAKIRPVLTDAQRAKISELEQQADGLAESLIARAGDD